MSFHSTPVLDRYVNAFNAHAHEFFTGLKDFKTWETDESEVEEIIQDDEIQEQHKLNLQMLRTVDPVIADWSETEKDQFFEFLGRYGINNISKIQQKIRTKSTIQIMAYYNLLKTATEYHKKKRRLFKRLITYEEFPAAAEFDEAVVAIEEDLSSKIVNISKTMVPCGPIGVDESEEDDDEDEIINLKSLVDLSHYYYGMSHLNKKLLPPKSVPIEIRVYLRQLVKEILTEVIRNLILDTFHLKRFAELKYKNFSEENSETTVENGVIPMALQKFDVLRAFMNIGLRRNLSVSSYLSKMQERLDFEVIDYERAHPDPAKRLKDVLDNYGRELWRMVLVEWRAGSAILSQRDNEQKRALRPFMVKPMVTFLKENNIPVPDLSDSQVIDRSLKETVENQQLLNEEEFLKSYGDTKFIIDNKSEDELLDNEIAWFLLSQETQNCDILDHINSETEQSRYLKEFKIGNSYKEVRARLGDDAQISEKAKYRFTNNQQHRVRKIAHHTKKKIRYMRKRLEELSGLSNDERRVEVDKEIKELKRKIKNEETGFEVFNLKLKSYSHGYDPNESGDDKDVSTAVEVFNKEDSDYYSDVFLEELEEGEVPKDVYEGNEFEEQSQVERNRDLDSDDDVFYDAEAGYTDDESNEDSVDVEMESIPAHEIGAVAPEDEVDDVLFGSDSDSEDDKPYDNPYEREVIYSVRDKLHAFKKKVLPGPQKEESLFQISPEMQALYSYSLKDE